MAVQHLSAFLSGVLQGLHLGRVPHTIAAVFGMVSRFLHCATVTGTAVLLVFILRQVLQASRMLQARLCFIRLLFLLLLATAGALPCAKQG